MATLEQRLNALATAIGADVKALRAADGNLASLSTTAKSNLVAAINEVYTLASSMSGSGAAIDDAAADSATDKVWSISKSVARITSAISALRDELRAGAGTALDTFAEVAAQLAADESAAAALATAVGNRVRFDAAQTLTGPQQQQARDNIAAADAAALATLTTNVGDTDQNLATVYTTARDA